ncbi:hypothetical protein [Spiroplasma ixodetis]|uniref:Uncharacterized protein n=1 Tax=Spiroplasma ixodetis TaxID=2141 RepID=A0ABN7BWD7_9MOLU
MFPITNQIQIATHDKPYLHDDWFNSLSRSIIKYKLTISKIVLNQR